MHMHADDIVKALQSKHSEDLVVPECKTGPTQGHSGLAIMDVWVMARSWAHPHTTCYEVKVSRQDFLKDNKWPGYMSYCNSMYFACPKDLIKVEELPADVGLVYVSDPGRKVYTKRKAVYRKVDIPANLWIYILMCRAKIDREWVHDANGRRRYWNNWLEEKKIDAHLGYHISKTLNKRIEEEVVKAQEHNKTLERQIEGLNDIVEMVKGLGLDPKHVNGYGFRNELRHKLEDRAGDLTDFISLLGSTRNDITKILDKLKETDDKTTTGRNDIE